MLAKSPNTDGIDAVARELPLHDEDTSILKQLGYVTNWAGGNPKQSAHLARADIHESIKELRFYRERMFVSS